MQSKFRRIDLDVCACEFERNDMVEFFAKY
jgi:methionine synthase II (cobalamin-independent)